MNSSHPSDKVGETRAFTIRDLQTYDEVLQVHGLQQTIWGFGEPGIGLYPPFLFTASKNGGVALGAFDPEGKRDWIGIV
jgi:predicted GNAT superfamily acetyltransferase